MHPVDVAVRDILVQRGWEPGTKLENQVMMAMRHFSNRPEQQHKVGKYRIDFAWPKIKVALEADGWWHRSPEGAAKDRQRDSWLRSQGWIIFRVDDEHGEEVLADQVNRVLGIIALEIAHG